MAAGEESPSGIRRERDRIRHVRILRVRRSSAESKDDLTFVATRYSGKTEGSMTDQTRHLDLIDRIREGHERLMQRMSIVHAEDFVAIDISMPQAKTLYLVVAAGAIHMSDLALRLHVTLSTVSGLVDRLVEGGLASRHDDPADRRQVVVTPTPAGARLIERFRELNERDLLSLLELLSNDELATVASALEAIDHALARREETLIPADGSDQAGATSARVPEGPTAEVAP